MKNKNDAAGTAAALAANIIFGCSFIFSKKALAVAHPLMILSVRFTVAFIAMSLLILTQRGAFACGEHIRVAVHRLFDEFIFAAAVIFLIPPLYFGGCFIRHAEVQPVFIFAHNSLQSAVRHARFR